MFCLKLCECFTVKDDSLSPLKSCTCSLSCVLCFKWLRKSLNKSSLFQKTKQGGCERSRVLVLQNESLKQTLYIIIIIKECKKSEITFKRGREREGPGGTRTWSHSLAKWCVFLLKLIMRTIPVMPLMIPLWHRVFECICITFCDSFSLTALHLHLFFRKFAHINSWATPTTTLPTTLPTNTITFVIAMH